MRTPDDPPLAQKARRQARRPRVALRKLGVLAVLYLVQGLPFGFLIGWLPLYLHARGLSVAKITFVTLVNVPWLLKFLWAPLADRYFLLSLGRRRSWILPAQLGLLLSLLLAAYLAPGAGLVGLLALLLGINLFAATQDIGVDGFAVDLLEDHERGVGNSVQAAAYKIGMIGGGYGLLRLFDPQEPASLQGCFLSMAGVVGVALLVPVLVREGPPPQAVRQIRQGHARLGRLVLSLFRRPGAALFLSVLLLAKAGDSIANPLFRLFLMVSGVSREDINQSMNLGGMVATLMGSALAGVCIMLLGRRRALWTTLLGQGVSHLGWAALAVWGVAMPAVWGIALVEHFVSGMLTVVLFTLMMDAVRPEVGSSQYTLLMCLYGGVGLGLGVISGTLVEAVGYGGAFGVAGGMTLATLGLVAPLGRRGYLAGHRPVELGEDRAKGRAHP